MITVGSIFSGIGGIEYGLEMTGQYNTIWQSEIEPYACKILKQRWPNVPNLGDITKIDWSTVERPDMVCGGFPCQSVSIAGKRRGLQDETKTGLWSECVRMLGILRPRLALFENVPNLAGWFEIEDGYPDIPPDMEGREFQMDINKEQALNRVICDLASCGYDAEWTIISAQSVGAWHRRDRLFIVAYPNSTLSGHGNAGDVEVFGNRAKEWLRTSTIQNRGTTGVWYRDPADIPDTDHKTKPDVPDHDGLGCIVSEPTGKTVEDTDSNGRTERGEDERKEDIEGDLGAGFWTTDTNDIAYRCAGGEVSGTTGTRQSEWATEPRVGRVANGVPKRVDRLKCLGNAVVPQVAEAIGYMILESGFKC